MAPVAEARSPVPPDEPSVGFMTGGTTQVHHFHVFSMNAGLNVVSVTASQAVGVVHPEGLMRMVALKALESGHDPFSRNVLVAVCAAFIGDQVGRRITETVAIQTELAGRTHPMNELILMALATVVLIGP